jgi:hypothetical protein
MARDSGTGGGPADELGTYPMRRGSRPSGSPAAWQSWGEGGNAERSPLPRTPLFLFLTQFLVGDRQENGKCDQNKR